MDHAPPTDPRGSCMPLLPSEEGKHALVVSSGWLCCVKVLIKYSKQLKCDAHRPICGNCALKGIDCQFGVARHKPRLVKPAPSFQIIIRDSNNLSKANESSNCTVRTRKCKTARQPACWKRGFISVAVHELSQPDQPEANPGSVFQAPGWRVFEKQFSSRSA